MRNQARERILLQLWKDACLELSIICAKRLRMRKVCFQIGGYECELHNKNGSNSN